jgi:hypothetical protein
MRSKEIVPQNARTTVLITKVSRWQKFMSLESTLSPLSNNAFALGVKHTELKDVLLDLFSNGLAALLCCNPRGINADQG